MNQFDLQVHLPGRTQVFCQKGKNRKGFLINKGLIIDHIAFPLLLRQGVIVVYLSVCNSNNTDLTVLKRTGDEFKN